MTNYDKLLAKLTEIFQLDRADLDFGIYRIMNSKRDEIIRFLENDLLPQVKQVLAKAQGDIGSAGVEELHTLESQIRAAGMNPDDSPKVRELRAKHAGGGDLGALEQEVFNHLYSFFRRYYDEGDFLSLRRYKEGVYAIPYEGEEVKLHWANADQYYIKTAEHFRDYTFKVSDGRRVHFKLVEAQTERDNNKEKEKRIFILKGDNPVTEEDGELIIRFEYRNDPGKRKQKDLSDAAEKAILATATVPWIAALTTKAPTAKDPSRTVLTKHLTGYTARNTFDYFIHKDLGGFLRRELDFYIKNEVMHLDDIENEAAPKVEQYLAKVRAIRRVAEKLVTFLEQLEHFQKRLWLKKKIVVETRYLIRLAHVPAELYPEISLNTAQREEWVRLLSIDQIKADLTTPEYTEPLSIRFLESSPSLVVDTRNFDEHFTQRLLSAIKDVDEQTAGLVIHSENLQALSFLRASQAGRIQCIYIDPPYNTDASEIIYKNDYKHSTWLSLITDRLRSSLYLLRDEGVACVTIDDAEVARLQLVLDDMMGSENRLGVACIRNNPQGRSTVKGFAVNHEFGLFYRNTAQANAVGRLERTQAQQDRYDQEDENGRYLWENFRKTGTDSNRADRPKQFYPLYWDWTSLRVPSMNWDADNSTWTITESPTLTDKTFWPINENGVEKVWKWGHDRVRGNPDSVKVDLGQEGSLQVFRKNHINVAGTLPGTWWDKAEYAAGSHGTNLLTNLFGVGHSFPFPKSVHAVVACLRVSRATPETCVLDYFAGSGTTGHAVINMNRDDDGRRSFVLVEMGEYFEKVLIPRIKKVIFTPEWKDGKPKRIATEEEAARSPSIVKILRLESYEDTLANLQFANRTETQTQLIETNDAVREDYIIRYVLNAETADSPCLLNIRSFDRPFECKLKIATDSVGETKDVNVDLVETFNWLLGLRVHTMDVIRGFHVITGRLPGPGNSENGEKALIIWRDTTENTNDKLDEFFGKQAYNTLDQEFDVIYVNGDNNLQNLRKDDQTWKVRLIEEEFHRLMWDVEDI